jgi:hypothetical protein
LFFWRTPSFVHMIRVILTWKLVWTVCGMAVTFENPHTRTKTFPSANLSTTNQTWTDPVSKPSLRCERVEIEDWNYLYCITYKIFVRTSQRKTMLQLRSNWWILNLEVIAFHCSVVCGIYMCTVWAKFGDFIVRYGLIFNYNYNLKG